ncbi:hypothetical protein C3747_121g11 [Trypanosoma cruzi]|uniref:EamA domain-containing protein n=2 Tax=Trypanosoma cruzi TaxID=5693 RepID=Q4CV91_TRYCC|nr:hypothetical protein, conserved [Trypanosoma cruzi]EAN84195.1 hypothetical protein, conserved [Trypanosoma cruzi]PWV05986.1 hypothetical protein C3747_121g11 [Trypanosoma cruzi]|eukprot:XP_806046.1 hypothetical protein [Trypanosoma cruzi strain CL Brener]
MFFFFFLFFVEVFLIVCGTIFRSHTRQMRPAQPSGRVTASNGSCINLFTQEAQRYSSKTSRMFFAHASLAGAFGALSAVVGKLAVTKDSDSLLFVALASFFSRGELRDAELQWVGVVTLVIRVLLFASNIFFTAQMWRWHLKALSCGPTPVCQIVNTGMNFAVSAFFGLFVFREEISAMWAVGALLVAIGLALVVSDADAFAHRN